MNNWDALSLWPDCHNAGCCYHQFLPIFSLLLDGGFSNNQPVFDELSSIRISPFAGGSHICPNDGPEDGSGTRPFISKWGGEVVNLTGTNMKRFYEALMPPEDLNIFYQQGYQHTNTFLGSSKFKQFLKNVPLSDIDNNNENHT